MRVAKREPLLERSKPEVEIHGELNPVLQQVDAQESSWRGGKVTLVPRATTQPCAGGCGSPLLCSQALLQEAGTQHPPRRIPAAQGMGRPAGSLRC